MLETFFREHFGKKFTKPTYEDTRRDKDGRFTAKMTIEIAKRRKTETGKRKPFPGNRENNYERKEEEKSITNTRLCLFRGYKNRSNGESATK